MSSAQAAAAFGQRVGGVVRATDVAACAGGKALTRAEKSEEREIAADGKELAKELNALSA